jgi:hypothetical protein
MRSLKTKPHRNSHTISPQATKKGISSFYPRRYNANTPKAHTNKTKSSKSTIDKLEEAAGISMEDLRKNGEWTDGWKDEEITKKIEEHQKEIDRIEVEYKKVKASYKKEDLAKKAVLIQEMKMYADRKTAVQKVRKLKKDLEKEERGLFDDEEKKGDDKKGDKK